jgi:hypothetical protein
MGLPPLAIALVLAAKTATVALPSGAPYRSAKLKVTTDTFAGPSIFSPIGGPDARARVTFSFDGGKEIEVLKDDFKRTFDSYQELDSGSYKLVPAPDGHGLAWCGGGCTTWGHVWFDGNEIFACNQQSSSTVPTMRQLALDELLRRVCSDEVEARALAWARAHPDPELDMAWVHWLTREDYTHGPRDEVAKELQPRLARSPEAAARVVELFNKFVANPVDTTQLKRFDLLSAGLPGRAKMPGISFVLRRPGDDAPIAGHVKLWALRNGGRPGKRVIDLAVKGGTVALDPPPGVSYLMAVLVKGTTPIVVHGVTPPYLIGETMPAKAVNSARVTVSRGHDALAGAKVSVFYQGLLDTEDELIASGTTGLDGQLHLSELPLGALLVEIRAPGELCDSRTVRLDWSPVVDQPVTIDLAKRRDFHGQLVSSPERKGIASMPIRASGYEAQNRPCLERTAVTDQDGKYTLTALSDGFALQVFAVPKDKPAKPVGYAAVGGPPPDPQFYLP